jgi:hypothetical protein
MGFFEDGDEPAGTNGQMEVGTIHRVEYGAKEVSAGWNKQLPVTNGKQTAFIFIYIVQNILNYLFSATDFLQRKVGLYFV